MITGILAFVFLVAIIASANDGNWGSAAVGAVIVVVLLLLGSEGRKCDRAYNNMVDYWANGGPEQNRKGGRGK